MGARDYLRKFSAYHDYLESGRYARDYSDFRTQHRLVNPTLFV